MSKPYRILPPVLVDGEYEQGDVVWKDLTADEEDFNLEIGLIELVPRRYKNISEDSRVYDSAPGEEFEVALTIGQEAHLIVAGVAEIVETEPPKKKPAKKKDAKAGA
jgi:hypothetical protein